MEQEYETIDLREIFFLLRHNALVIILSAVVCAAIGFAWAAFAIAPVYQADASMIVNTRQDQSSNVTNDQLNSAKQLVAVYSIIVKSDTVLSQVIGNLGLNMDYETLNGMVSVQALDATSVMQISVKNTDPKLATKISQEIVKLAPDIIRDKVEAGSVKVISEPRLRESPVYPSKKTFTAVAGLLGFVLSVGVVFLKEMLNNTFKNDADIQKHLGIPVLGVIPEIRQEGKR